MSMVKTIKVVDHDESFHSTYFAVSESFFAEINPNGLSVIISDQMSDDKWQGSFNKLLCHPPCPECTRFDLEIRMF